MSCFYLLFFYLHAYIYLFFTIIGNGGGIVKKRDTNIVALEGRKTRSNTQSDDDDAAKLLVEGEVYDLDSFVLSGNNKDGKRIIFSWNVSLEEMVGYTKTLDVVCSERIKDALGE
jgi:hypothetical protein